MRWKAAMGPGGPCIVPTTSPQLLIPVASLNANLVPTHTAAPSVVGRRSRKDPQVSPVWRAIAFPATLELPPVGSGAIGVHRQSGRGSFHEEIRGTDEFSLPVASVATHQHDRSHRSNERPITSRRVERLYRTVRRRLDAGPEVSADISM